MKHIVRKDNTLQIKHLHPAEDWVNHRFELRDKEVKILRVMGRSGSYFMVKVMLNERIPGWLPKGYIYTFNHGVALGFCPIRKIKPRRLA